MRTCLIPSFGILGTADHYFHQAIEHLPKDRIVIERADHALYHAKHSGRNQVVTYAQFAASRAKKAS